MGYYTNYTLNIENANDETLQSIYEKLQQEKILGYAFYDEGVTGSYTCIDAVKWYEHNNDMKNISSYFPNVLFTLEGEGEEPGDLWITYYKNGKMQHCPAQITFDTFDEKKLI